MNFMEILKQDGMIVLSPREAAALLTTLEEIKALRDRVDAAESMNRTLQRELQLAAEAKANAKATERDLAELDKQCCFTEQALDAYMGAVEELYGFDAHLACDELAKKLLGHIGEEQLNRNYKDWLDNT